MEAGLRRLARPAVGFRRSGWRRSTNRARRRSRLGARFTARQRSAAFELVGWLRTSPNDLELPRWLQPPHAASVA
ncbi:hypothetical protein PAI11_09780 [Patulibacter medicamentivorans]|uniref:Uncharacterized protein n=1 Tax=Patulibacter medicamentivorans TaxID=1097667 RepID=H0E2G5_9ACTN|nr:hypothetical protein PAI11_09780 [Patulibacter medicamentivorans]